MIISDQGFWEQLHTSHGTHLVHSSAYHPPTDGQTKQVNQIHEYILRVPSWSTKGLG
jgi:hypothetical protein